MSGAGAPQLNVDAAGLNVVVVASRWHTQIMDGLLAGAERALRKAGNTEYQVIRVPGAFELPLAVQRVAAGKKYDGIIALGAVIRGGTPHFEYVSGECTKGIAQVMMQHDIPVAFGVLTVDSIEQAIERAGTKAGNKGCEAAMSTLEMVNLLAKL